MFWLRNARWAALPQSLMPALTAAAMSAGLPGFSAPLAALAVAGVCLAHLSFNLLDDFFDYISHKTGYRQTLVRRGVRAFTGKCTYLTEGNASLTQLAVVCAMLGGLAVCCGAVIFFVRGRVILMIAALTLFLGFFYSGRPLRLSYHGLGELVIGLVFGPLNMAGVACSACGSIPTEVAVSGLHMGLLVANILYTHSVLDYEADQSVHKTTLAALCRTDRGRLLVSALFIFLPYAVIVLGIAGGYLPVRYCVVWLTFPMGLALFRSVRSYVCDHFQEAAWKPWYGPCGNLQSIQASGLGWFKMRWRLARNLTAATALCYSAASICEKAGAL